MVQIKKPPSPPTLIGKAYSPEMIQKLVSELSSGSSDREIKAFSEFVDHQEQVFSSISDIPDLTNTEVIELILATVMRYDDEIIKNLEAEKKKKQLQFLATTPYIPFPIQEKAKAAVKRLHTGKFQEKVTIPPLHVNTYSPKRVELLVQNLNSERKEQKIPAAVEFIHNYPRITPTVSKMPMLTVTQVTTKAIEIIDQNPKEVIRIMVSKKMVSELFFLASLSQAPPKIRDMARKAAETLQLKLRLPSQKPPTQMPKQSPKPTDVRVQTLKLQKSYMPLELEALVSGLGSVESVRSVKAAIEFLKNYQIIAETIAKTPQITITEVTTKVAQVVDNNLDVILKELERQKAVHAVNFLANSEKFSMAVREQAKKLLERMQNPFYTAKKSAEKK